MAFDAEGTLFVALAASGRVVALPDRDRDGRADRTVEFASGLDLPHGIDSHEGWLYVAETGRVVRFRDTDGDLRADLKEEVIGGLPTGGLHWTRTVRFGPAGRLYLSIGSSCDLCTGGNEGRAVVRVYEPDGSRGRIFARGLRNSVGIAWHPETGELWATENGSDFLGDDLPPDELNIVREGRHYGWPDCYGKRVPHPEFNRRTFCEEETEPPALELPAHSAPLGLAFYTGGMFPPEYRGDLFIAYHGSIYRSILTGYKVVRVRVEGARHVGVEDFAAGWNTRLAIIGRPTGLAVAPDGSLFVSDDSGGRIYRISYRSPQPSRVFDLRSGR